jgi:hypothetical protein
MKDQRLVNTFYTSDVEEDELPRVRSTFLYVSTLNEMWRDSLNCTYKLKVQNVYLNDTQIIYLSDVVIQLFYPFREKLATYRGYRILGDNGLNRYHRSIIISKQRYGIADQVININFFGSVGWWRALPPPEEIVDYTQFQSEYNNIPCKSRKEKQQEDTTASKQADLGKKKINYLF